jgi:hypothetical protein
MEVGRDIRLLYLAKWLLIVLSLLLIPKSGVIIVVAIGIFYIAGKLDNLDVVISFFLIFFIQNSLSSLGDLVMIRYLLIPLLLIRPLPDSTFSFGLLLKRNVSLGIFLVYIVLNVFFISSSTSHSLFEFVSFIILLLFTFKGAYTSSYFNMELKKANLESVFLVILVTSILVLPIPQIGYARNGIGFQGITIHPNNFGVFLAPFCGYYLIKLISRKYLTDSAILLVSLIFLILTQSRTSLFSLVLGMGIYASRHIKVGAYFARSILLLSVPTFLFLTFNYKTVEATISEYLVKGNTSSSFSESLVKSRGNLVNAQLNNIASEPIYGIGFKIPSNRIAITKQSSNDLVFYEKGNMILACLEELGLVGCLIFVYLLISMILSTSKVNYGFEILAIISIFTTLGEATLFSIGGLGILIWTLLFLNSNLIKTLK